MALSFPYRAAGGLPAPCDRPTRGFRVDGLGLRVGYRHRMEPANTFAQNNCSASANKGDTKAGDSAISADSDREEYGSAFGPEVDVDRLGQMSILAACGSLYG